MNEKRIQEVIKIEKQADEIFNKSVVEAQRIPLEAEQEAKRLFENIRVQAEKEAQALLASTQTSDDTDRILREAETTMSRNETMAKRNLDRATTYVIARVVGRG